MQKITSAFALFVIAAGLCYAAEREHVRKMAEEFYAEDNTRYFDSKLPRATVRWTRLQEQGYLGLAQAYSDGSYEILLDRYDNASERETRSTLHHEECHIATWNEVAEQREEHGPAFQTCIERLKSLGLDAN